MFAIYCSTEMRKKVKVKIVLFTKIVALVCIIWPCSIHTDMHNFWIYRARNQNKTGGWLEVSHHPLIWCVPENILSLVHYRNGQPTPRRWSSARLLFLAAFSARSLLGRFLVLSPLSLEFLIVWTGHLSPLFSSLLQREAPFTPPPPFLLSHLFFSTLPPIFCSLHFQPIPNLQSLIKFSIRLFFLSLINSISTFSLTVSSNSIPLS